MATLNTKPGWAHWLFIADLSFDGGNIAGSSGIDTIVLDNHANNRVFLYGGDDSVFAAAKGDDSTMNIISGGNGADRIYGNSATEYVDGGTGDDFIFGEAGDYFLFGNSGADYLSGGVGLNKIWGGSGNDTYSSIGYDIIRDSSGTDNYSIASGADVSVYEAGRETDTMVFAFAFGGDTIFKRRGADLIIRDEDGTRVEIHDAFSKNARNAVDVFVDAEANVVIFSLLDLGNGDIMTGLDLI
jgi:Ca2+-binding RTX toxin-like protein